MNPDTRAALLALAEALANDPAAALELSTYGNLPEHLLDLIHDLEEHPEHFEA